ncbi:CRISPR-associated endonuclease Cas2 [Flaviflexus equikiangi]|uniref:CRISPR-associated endonuclease Cas2 n=1 Tax=Flaviflexus equikiangi TaxID=2758573 RepID=UPI00165E95FF
MNRKDAHRYLVAYDVPDDKRRTRLSKLLSSYGERMQFSVFLIDLTRASLMLLTDQLEELMDRDDDAILICDLGTSREANQHSIRYLGRQAKLPQPQSFIV